MRRWAGTARRSRRRTPRARRVSPLVDRTGADPRRLLRRRARHRRRHDAEGLPRTEQGRARRRPRLAALPAARRDEPDLLRAVRAPAHGAVRRDPRGLRAGEGEERAARARQPVRRVTARRSAIDDVLDGADRLRPARAARHLRDERRCRRDRDRRSLDYARAPRRRRSGAHHGDLDGDARAIRRRRSSSRTSRPTPRPAPATLPAHGFKESIAAPRVRGGRRRSRRPRLRGGLRPLDRDGARLVRADRAVRARRGREAACATARRRSAAASP